jgi:hypothetical protein
MAEFLDPAQLIFTLEPGMSDDEIDLVMRRCAKAQAAMDEFLTGDVDEDELCAILEDCTVNVDRFAETVNYNLDWLGIPRVG